MILYDAKRTLTARQVQEVKFQIRDDGDCAGRLIDAYIAHQQQQIPGQKRRKFNISHNLLELMVLV